MNLLELTEPIFQYVCRLNRLARKSGGGKTGETSFIAKSPGQTPTAPRVASLEYAVVRSEVKAMFEDFLTRSNSDMRLNVQARKVELPLLFFVDSMISDSALPFAAQWNQNRLAYERNELAGDEKFFDLLEETMKDSSEDASERLAVFYNCVGLGFSGIAVAAYVIAMTSSSRNLRAGPDVRIIASSHEAQHRRVSGCEAARPGAGGA